MTGLDLQLLHWLVQAARTERLTLLGRVLTGGHESGACASALRVHWTRHPYSGEPGATLLIAEYADDPRLHDVTALLLGDPQAASLLAELLAETVQQQAEPGVLDFALPQEGPGLSVHLSFTLADQPGVEVQEVQQRLADSQVFDHLLVSGLNSPPGQDPAADLWAAPEFILEVIGALQDLHTWLQHHACPPVEPAGD